MELNYNVIFSRRRSISIIVSPDKGVTVRAPFRTSMKAIDRYVSEKSSWIEKHTNKFSKLTRINQMQYKDGESIHLLGKTMILRIVESDQLFVRISDNYLEVGVNKAVETRMIRILLDRWYRNKAQKVFSIRLTQLLEKYRKYGFNPSGFTVRTLKSRWGSCNSKGKITLNTQLVKLNESYIDYVITHELCHLRYRNHGKEFYRLLGELVPDYKTKRKELKKYITG